MTRGNYVLFPRKLCDVCLSQAPLAFCQGRLYLHEKPLKCISHILNGCDICWHSKMANKKYNSLYWNCNCECYSHADKGDDNNIMMMTITWQTQWSVFQIGMRHHCQVVRPVPEFQAALCLWWCHHLGGEEQATGRWWAIYLCSLALAFTTTPQLFAACK